ncbi:MAG: YnbE family lipoprotein [Chitinivibrionales bacterium]|nr:YnbE family lipoprotein [Chitinivibrionales bacterium]MBD3355682.1 YnbE family lipoprotein [Chitinivibrionales bacterium]
MQNRPVVIGVGFAFLLLSCTPTVRVKHEVEPIHVTVDVYVKVQRELEEFFQFEEKLESTKDEGEQSSTD